MADRYRLRPGARAAWAATYAAGLAATTAAADRILATRARLAVLAGARRPGPSAGHR